LADVDEFTELERSLLGDLDDFCQKRQHKWISLGCIPNSVVAKCDSRGTPVSSFNLGDGWPIYRWVVFVSFISMVPFLMIQMQENAPYMTRVTRSIIEYDGIALDK
jgi:hypothetical protein